MQIQLQKFAILTGTSTSADRDDAFIMLIVYSVQDCSMCVRHSVNLLLAFVLTVGIYTAEEEK